MAHSKIKIWVHAILGTKNHYPFIKNNYQDQIYSLIKDEIAKTKCVLNTMNGTAEHVHLLFLLHPDKSIREVMHQIKGGSSYQINRAGIFNQHFNWQIGSGAFSVSESGISNLKNYIHNQKEHHKKMTFEEEYQKFLKLYGLV